MNTKFNIKRRTSLSVGTALLVVGLAYKCNDNSDDETTGTCERRRTNTDVVNAINAVANNSAVANAIDTIVYTAVDAAAADKYNNSSDVAVKIFTNNAVTAAVANVIYPNKVVADVAHAAAIIAIINRANITAITVAAAVTVIVSTAINAAGDATAIIAAIGDANEAAIKTTNEAAIVHNATTANIIAAAARVFVDAIENPGSKMGRNRAMRRDRMMRPKK